jgi:hypothetical protein
MIYVQSGAKIFSTKLKIFTKENFGGFSIEH